MGPSRPCCVAFARPGGCASYGDGAGGESDNHLSYYRYDPVAHPLFNPDLDYSVYLSNPFFLCLFPYRLPPQDFLFCAVVFTRIAILSGSFPTKIFFKPSLVASIGISTHASFGKLVIHPSFITFPLNTNGFLSPNIALKICAAYSPLDSRSISSSCSHLSISSYKVSLF